ncbi:MAG: hypothetical protein DRP01_02325 [Archaeoglobales archaeon]|nr:MAG: hypothetical protein DRP01_02325 [Archaeoglobales archaeon]
MYEKVSVIGLGHVGLPAAVLFASKGLQVTGIDIDEHKVRAVNMSKCYIKEPRLDDLLREVVSNGLLTATTNGIDAVKLCDAVIIAVPTPIRNNIIDLSYLKSALEVVKQGLHKDLLIVIESTIPPKLTVDFIKPFLEESGLSVEKDFFLAHVPERIAPGRAIEELLHIPRVIGGVGPKSTRKAVELYSRVNPNLLLTDATTAEFIKLVENSFRDLNIAFANFLALVAEKIGIDVYEAIKLANTHPRVNIHKPGAGVGGPCLTKDPYMLTKVSENIFGVNLIFLARKINDYMPYHVVKIVDKALDDVGVSMRDAKIAILGVSYKGNVSDTRNSPAKVIVKELLRRNVSVVVYDPYTSESFGAERARSLKEALKGADVMLIVTDHSEFKNIDLNTIGNIMRHRIIVDGRRVFEPFDVTKKGFKYYGIGFGKAIKI